MRRFFLLAVVLLSSTVSYAQTPGVSGSPPAEAFAGEQICYEAVVANTGAPGFNPYIRVSLEPGLNFDSAVSFGSALTPVAPTPLTFPPAPGNEVTDPLTMTDVSGPEGGTFVILRPPIGSLVDGAPPIPVELCFTIDPSADVGVPLDVTVQPVYELGDTATGDNGPIEGAPVTNSITPVLILIDKRSTAPEAERPPGPTWAYQYALEVNIAEGQTIDDLVITDILPAALVYNGTLSVTGGTGCIATEPALGSAGGTLEVTCASATGGPAADDVLITFQVYIDDVLSVAACDAQPIINPLTVDAMFGGNALPTLNDNALVTTANAVVQKGVAPTDVNPGDQVDFVLDIQITEFSDATALVVDDLLPSGMDLVENSLSINGGAAITFTTPLNSSAASFAENGDGTTSILVDLVALGVTTSGASGVQLTYQADILSAFGFGGGGAIQASDSLTNTANIAFDLSDGAAGCDNGTGATVVVQPVLPVKEIVTAGPYQPGDAVTFRLTLEVPSGDTSQIAFTDFFPLPVFDATSVSTATPLGGNPDITLAPTNTLAGIEPTSIVADAASNSVRIEWPDIVTNAAQVLAVEITIEISDEPFADGLILSNLFQTETENSVGDAAAGLDPINFEIGAPDLIIDKSAISTSSGIAPDADGNVTGVDAGDVVTFEVTLINEGGAPAFDVTLTDITPAGFSSCALVSAEVAGIGVGTTGSLAAGLVLDDALAESDDAVAGLDEAIITLDCTVDAVSPEDLITNEASATWASQPGATPFPPIMDDATAEVPGVTVSKERISIFPSEADLGLTPVGGETENEVAIGSVVRYRVSVTLPEGESVNNVLRDQLDNGLAFANLNGLAGDFCLGTIPAEVTISNPDVNATCSNVGTAAGDNPRLVTVGGIPARRAVFDLDTVTVSAAGGFSDQSTSATIIFEYVALVLDVGNNNDGNNRNNDAEWRPGANANGGGGTVVAEDSAANVVIREPNFTLTKNFSPAAGDAGTPTTVTIVVTAAGGNNNPDGFEVLLEDVLDPNLVFAGNLTTTAGACDTPPDGGSLQFDGGTQTVSAEWTTFTKGTSCEITFDATVAATAPIGTSIDNTAELDFSGLPGGGFEEANEVDNQSPYIDEPRDSERTETITAIDSFLVAAITQEKTIIGRTETAGSGQGDAAIADVTVGEVITYNVLVTIPDGSASNVAITDQTVTAPFKLELLSVSPITIGAEIEDQANLGNPPIPVVSINDSDMDGLDDQAVIALGDIFNVNDTAGTVAADNQIEFQVTARVADVLVNAAGSVLRNNAIVSSDTFPDVIASADVELVEPNLTASKSGSIGAGQAGDVVTFTLDVGHSGTSTADARQVTITDTLPTTFNSVANLAFVGGGTCPSATPSSSTITANVVTITFDEIPFDEVCRFTYDATIDPSAEVTSTIRNDVDIAYASTDEAEADEQARDYTGGTDFPITISGPGIDKSFIGSADPNTPDTGGVLGPEPDITIGEEITYLIQVTIPSGTTADAVVTEQLPFPGGAPAAEFSLVSATFGAVPVGVTIGSGLAVGAGPSNTIDSAPLDGIDDRFEFDLGDVVNSSGSAQILEFTVVAVPNNVPANFDLDNVRNTATLDFTVGGVDQPPLTDSSDVDLVRPDLQIDKTPDSLPDQSAADTLTFTIEISHTGLSNAPAYDLALTDTLPSPGSSAPTNVMASAGCQGFGFSVPDPKTLSVTIDQLDNGDVCTITYDVTVDGTVVSGETYSNEASTTFDSTPDGTGDTFGPITDTGMFSIDRPDLMKAVFFVENPVLGTSTEGDPLIPDAQIGAEVCYHSTITFPEGITEDAVFSDTLPSGSANGTDGIMEITSATVFGAGMLGASNGFADIVISDGQGGDGIDDTATFDFGDITNPTVDNAVTDSDQLVLQVCGRILDLGPTDPNDPDTNEEGDTLTNTSQVSFTDPAIGGTTTQADTADIEVVEPDPAVTKSLVSVVDGLLTIQIDLVNNGLGTGFDVEVTDTLAAADFDLSTIASVTVPTGYQFAVTGGNTAAFTSDPAAMAPDNTLEPGETVSFVFQVMLADPPPDLTNPISNTAEASVTSMPGAPAEDRTSTGSDTVDLELPLLDATKADALQVDADSSTSVSGGDTLRYTLVISNTGTAAATDVIIEDLLGDANLTLVAGSVTTTAGAIDLGNGGADATVQVTVPTIAAGGSVTVTFDALIASPLPPGVTQVENQATISSDEQEDFVSDDPATGPNDDPTVVPLARIADLSITKTASPNPAVPGENVTFTLLVENLGPDPVADAQVTDALPVELLNPTWQCAPSAGASCTTAPTSIPTGGTINDGPNTLPVGGTLTYLITGQVDPSATVSISNSASVGSPATDDPVTANDDDDIDVPLTPLADLAVDKSTPTTTLNAGDNITYAVVVTNNGPSDAVAAQLFDPTPAGTAFISADAPCAAGFPCALGTLAPGDVVTINVTYQVDDPYAGSGTVFNEASVNSSTTDPVPGNNADDVTTPVGSAASADLSLVKTGPPSAAAGSTVTFTLTANNAGPSDAQNVVITDPIPAGLTFNSGTPACAQVGTEVECALGTIGVGDSAIATITFDIPAAYAGPDPIGNAASVGSDTPDPDPSNNDGSANVPLGASSVDLSVDKTGPATANAGDTVVYTIVVANAGPGDATGVVLDDPAAAGLTYNDAASDALCDPGAGGASCAIGSLAAGDSIAIDIAFDVDDPYSGPAVILNTATASANEPEADPSNNSDDASTSTTGDAPADLSVMKDGPPVLAGDNTIAYTILVTNEGPGDAINVVLTDPVPAQLTYLDPDSDSRCDLVGPDVACTIGTLISGGSTTLLLTFAVPLDYTGPDPVINEATVSSDTPDGNPANDTDDHPVDMPLPILEADKAGVSLIDADTSGDLSPGDTIRYTVQIDNSGQVAATTVAFTDTPDVNTTLVVGSVTTSLGTVITGNVGGDSTIAVDVGQIDGQGSVTITYDVTVNSPFPANVSDITNQGEITSDQLPPESTNDPATPGDDDPTILPITAAPALSAEKSDTLFDDADGNGIASPGDTLRYTVVLANSGNGDASGVFFADMPDANTALVVGSVSATAGTIVLGNTGGDTDVNVDIGTLAGDGGTVTITFDVLIDDPLAAGVTELANQGRLDSDQLPSVPTDDPDTLPGNDPTVTPLGAAPVLDSFKRAALQNDADGDGVPSPGDTLRYTITIVNSGNQDASGVNLIDTPDGNSSLIVGSVTTDTGLIVVGNTAGDATVEVDVGTLTGQGGTALVEYDVVVVDPLPLGVTQVVNQGQVSSNELPAIPTDDPGTGPTDDPTIVPLTAAPVLSATKRDQLFADNDGDGVPSPGDELIYFVDITNSGNTAASGVVFADTPGINTTLVTGSAMTSQGTVNIGNLAGDTSVEVDVGVVNGGGTTVSISFVVSIDNPLPASITQVENQGLVNSNELPVVPTDDPDDVDPSDPTDTPIAAVPILDASKTETLIIDADSDGVPSPGDTLRYTVTIVNSGNIAASGLVFTDIPDPNTTLLNGTVLSAPLGIVVVGNTAGDSSIEIDIGTLPGGGATETITYDVEIVSPLPPGVTSLLNQGLVASNELPTEPTDDPTVPGDGDPTEVPLTAAPNLVVSKTDTLSGDNDGNGFASPGDTLTYLIVITNTGNQSANATFVNDTLDPNVTLLVGSVATSRGIVSLGNTAGDVNVAIDTGVIPGNGETAIISFEVTINDPLPAGVIQVANQAVVTSPDLPPVLSDDPDLPGSEDPTPTPITTEPELLVSKTDALLVDADSNGIASPGDTLLYTVELLNPSNVQLTGVTFNDTPDANTALLVGSVAASAGTITQGNSAGDSTVGVSIGAIPGRGGLVTVTFEVTINSPLPAGVTQLLNQGVAGSDQLPDVPSDDPSLPGDQDPTPTPIGTDPSADLFKAVVLQVDADSNGVPSPGDTLSYLLTVLNTGNVGLTGLAIADTPDANATLVNGSVTTALGSVTLGNAAGDTSVGVTLGALAGGGSVTIAYDVIVNSPLPAGVTQIENQAVLGSDQLPDVPSDDPTTGQVDDPTIVSVVAEPRVVLSKTATLLDDADGSASVSPGDTVGYEFVVSNFGNAPSTATQLNDTPDANSSLIVGSVASSQGNVLQGNAAGDTSISVDLGTLAPGSTNQVQFSVLVLPTAGGGTLVNQGSVSGDDIATTPSDDPSVPGTDDPTSVPVVQVLPGQIAVTKTLSNFTRLSQTSVVVEFTIVVSNIGDVDLINLQLTDDLTMVYPAPQSFVIDSVTTALSRNPSFDGLGDVSLLTGTDTLPIGGSETLVIQLTVNTAARFNNTQNTVEATASNGVDPVSAVASAPSLLLPEPDAIPLNGVWAIALLIALMGLIGIQVIRARPYRL